MDDNRGSTGWFGVLIAAIVAVGAMIFIVTGGDLGGKKKVEGDADMPPVSTTPK
jgi:hypothetical protein